MKIPLSNDRTSRLSLCSHLQTHTHTLRSLTMQKAMIQRQIHSWKVPVLQTPREIAKRHLPEKRKHEIFEKTYISNCPVVCLSVATPHPHPQLSFSEIFFFLFFSKYFFTPIFFFIQNFFPPNFFSPPKKFSHFQYFMHFWMFYAILSAQKNFHPKFFWVKQGVTQCYQAFLVLVTVAVIVVVDASWPQKHWRRDGRAALTILNALVKSVEF